MINYQYSIALGVCLIVLLALVIAGWASVGVRGVRVYSGCDFTGRTTVLTDGTHRDLPFAVRSLEVPYGCGVRVGDVAQILKEHIAAGQPVAKRRCLESSSAPQPVYVSCT